MASTIGRAEPPQLIIIENPNEILHLVVYIQQFALIAFDTETTGVHKGSEVIGLSICAEENKAYYIILSKWNPKTNTLDKIPGMDSYLISLLHQLEKRQLIMHNGLFDCTMVLDNFGVSLIESLHTDTMILAHLLNENRKVGLKDLGVEYFGEDAAKEAKEMKESVAANSGSITKVSYEMYKADSQLLAKYGAKDALLTYKLFMQLVPELYEQNLADFFYKDESMPLLRGPTWELNTTGLRVDVQAMTELKKTLEAECAEAKEFINNEIYPHIKEKYPGTNKKNKFNIGASQQLSWLLFGQLNLEFNTLTKAGKTACKDLGLKIPYNPSAKRAFISACLQQQGDPQYATVTSIDKENKTVTISKSKKFKAPWAYIAADKATLKKFSTKYKWIDKLLEYNRKMKILSTYVEGIEERTQYGIIRPGFLQHGTTSGRYASRNPNFQNLPRDDKRIKACITSRAGRVFVGADQSQLEPRVFAYYSNDERLLQAFRGTDDFYSVIGMEVYGKHDCTPHKEGSENAFGVKYKKLRDLSKVIALASTYGATAAKLAPVTGKSIEDTQNDIDNYFEHFPGVKKMMTDSHKLAKKQGFVENLFGRKRRIPEAMKIDAIYKRIAYGELPYETRNMLNLSVNHRIQSTGASIVNRAAIRFHEMKTQAGIDCKLVLQVHDSLIVECDEADAEDVSILLQEAMENTTNLNTIKFEAIPKIGKSLAEV